MESMYGLLLLFGLFVSVVTVLSHDVEEWNAFKLKYGKTYKNETEEKSRMEIFFKNKHKIDEHNEQHSKGLVSYDMDLNEYSDLSADEFMTQMTTKYVEADLLGATHIENGTNIWNDCNYFFNGSQDHHHHYSYHYRDRLHNLRLQQNSNHLPDAIDWRDEGAVNAEVPHQSGCGACAIFSGIAAIEGQHFRKTGKLLRLSEQNVIDCSEHCSCNGCWPAHVYKYAMENGINTVDLYPYEASDGVCKHKPDDSNVKIKGCMRVPRGNEVEMKEALATVGPIAVSFDCGHKFSSYSSGVYYEPECRQNTFGHSVLLVGYGTTEKGEDYYIAKNWWGDGWGERGYFRIARNRGNHCGITTDGVYPVA